MSRATRPQARRGFTLVEVLVALAVTALALVAGLKASAALTHNASRQGDLLLGQICAENQLIALRLARQLPSVGSTQSTCQQAGRALQLDLQVHATPNPNFRRVEAAVSQHGHTITRVTTIIGRN